MSDLFDGAGRVVVRVPNWLGDAVMALPALAALRRALGDRTMIVAGRSAIAPLFAEMTSASPDEVLVLDREHDADQIRGARADAIVLLTNSFRTAWTARQAGVPVRAGYRGSGRSWLLTRDVARPRGGHQVDYYRTLISGCGIDTPDRIPAVAPRPASVAGAAALLRKHGVRDDQVLVGFAPGAAYGHAKQWPPARVAGVMAALAGRGARPVIVGAAADRETARAIESSLPADVRVIDLAGATTLGTLAGVIARCAAFVSNDSGAMHLAAAAGVPVTAIFGPTDERATAPLSRARADVLMHPVFCRPCMLRECPIDHRCMRGIGAATVVDSVVAHLSAGPAR